MTKGKWLIVGIVAFVGAVAGWYLGSPWYTLHQLKSAAEAKDAEAFSSYIDFPALREDLKSEMMAQMMAEAQKGDNQFAGLGLAFGSAIVGPMVDGMISPAGVKAMFMAQDKAGPSNAPDRAPTKIKDTIAQDSPVIKRRGFSEFLVASEDEPDGGLVFVRHGLSWKLSGMDIPLQGAS